MIKNLLGDDEPAVDTKEGPPSTSTRSGMLGLFDTEERQEVDPASFVISDPDPASRAEAFRQSGLAWSAGVAFFAAVVFMMIVGWGADLLLGSSPWGMVGGIVMGSIIGFVQFFRLTSQIFKK